MQLKRLKITKLFDQFDYDIPLDNEEGLCILTGPNGYGKTVILNILDSIFKMDFPFFGELLFENILLEKTNGECFFLKKEKNDRYILQYFFLENIAETNKKGYWLIENRVEIIKQLKDFLENNTALFITTDRLRTRDDKETLVIYAKQLHSHIAKTNEDAYQLKEGLERTYPLRIKDITTISESEFNARFQAIALKLDALERFNIGVNQKQAIPEYDAESAKLLSLYLSDTEKKFAVYDVLIAKLTLFTTILNKKRFTDKQIVIKTDKLRQGDFTFQTSANHTIDANQLSLGEQHQLILLYELVFNVGKNSVLLIDEPENSLHVGWQRLFIDDLLAIIQAENLQVIVVTHSPQIIGSHRDLTYDLYAYLKNKIEKVWT